MVLKFTKEETLKVIEDYYEQKENRNVKAKMKSERGLAGYGMGEYETCYTRVSIEEDITILGRTAKKIDAITDKDILVMFNSLLEGSEYEATSLTFDDGVNKRLVGYGMNERDEVTPYCKGVTLNIKTKAKQKIIGGK